MKELIKIERMNFDGGSEGTEVNTVNARELWEAIEVKKDFSSWIKAQINRARLLENRDFITLTQKGERKPGVRGASFSKEYFLTLDAAKHVVMISGTEKGFELRDYFIECEKRLAEIKANPLMALMDKPKSEMAFEFAIMLEEGEKKYEKEKAKFERAMPHIIYSAREFSRNKTLEQVASALQVAYGPIINRITLPGILRDNDVLYYDTIGKRRIMRANNAYLESGCFIAEQNLLYTKEKNPVMGYVKGGEKKHLRGYKLLVTPEGMKFIAELLSSLGFEKVPGTRESLDIIEGIKRGARQ